MDPFCRELPEQIRDLRLAISDDLHDPYGIFDAGSGAGRRQLRNRQSLRLAYRWPSGGSARTPQDDRAVDVFRSVGDAVSLAGTGLVDDYPSVGLDWDHRRTVPAGE